MAVVLQDDDVQADDEIISAVTRVSGRLGVGVELYVHPVTPDRRVIALGSRFPGVRIHRRLRHRDQIAVVTRYSTLGLSYHAAGVPVMFVPCGVYVCAFGDPELMKARCVGEMEQWLEGVVDMSQD